MADNTLYSLERAFALLTTFGYTSPNKYFVSFYNLPRSLLSIPTLGTADQGRLKIACEAVDLPVKNITIDDLKIGHHTRKSATGYTVDPIKLTYRCSRDMMEKVFFDKWLDLICDPDTGSMEYHANFTCDVVIEVLDGGGKTIYAVQLHEAFPMSVSSSGLSFQSTNETLKVDAQIAYTKITILPIGIAGTDTKQSEENLQTLVNTVRQADIQAKIDSDRVSTREPQIATLGLQARLFLQALLIPDDNAAYTWNDYFANVNQQWKSQSAEEVLADLDREKGALFTPQVKDAIMSGGVNSGDADSAISILADQADGVMNVLENISPFTVYL